MFSLFVIHLLPPQDHPKFESLPPRPESGEPEPEDDPNSDPEEELEPTIADSDEEEDDDVDADEEETSKRLKRTRETAGLDEIATSSAAASSKQPKLVTPLSIRSPARGSDDQVAKKKRVPIFAAIDSEG